MILIQTIKNLILFFVLLITVAQTQNCTTLNPDDYGNCDTLLGYVWNGNECIIVSGCDMQNDQEFFYNSFEEC